MDLYPGARSLSCLCASSLCNAAEAALLALSSHGSYSFRRVARDAEPTSKIITLDTIAIPFNTDNTTADTDNTTSDITTSTLNITNTVSSFAATDLLPLLGAFVVGAAIIGAVYLYFSRINKRMLEAERVAVEIEIGQRKEKLQEQLAAREQEWIAKNRQTNEKEDSLLKGHEALVRERCLDARGEPRHKNDADFARAVYTLLCRLSIARLKKDITEKVFQEKREVDKILLPQKEPEKWKCRYPDKWLVKKTMLVIPELGLLHANFILGYGNLIAAQHPTKAEIPFLWETILRKKVTGIVQLNSEIEDLYIPLNETTPLTTATEDGKGSITVLLEEVVIEPLLTRRKLKMTLERGEKQQSISVMHYHYAGWQDESTPIEDTVLVRLLDMVFNSHVRSSSGVFVHCAAGSGRTGAFLLMLLLLKRYLTCKEPLKRLSEADVIGGAVLVHQSRASAFQGIAQVMLSVHAVLKLLFAIVPERKEPEVAAFADELIKRIGAYRNSEFHQRKKPKPAKAPKAAAVVSIQQKPAVTGGSNEKCLDDSNEFYDPASESSIKM